jgi:hypothetical protein
LPTAVVASGLQSLNVKTAHSEITLVRVAIEGYSSPIVGSQYLITNFGGKDLKKLKEKEKTFSKFKHSEEKNIVSCTNSVTNEIDPELERVFLSAISSPRQMPIYILLQLNEQLEKLQDPKATKFLISILFKAYENELGVYFSPFFEALEDERYRLLFHQFIQKSMDKFSHPDPDGNYSHNVILILHSLNFLFLNALKKEHLDSTIISHQMEFLRSYLSKTEDSSEKKIYIMLNLGMFFLQLQQTTDSAFDVFKMWMHYKTFDESLLEKEGYSWLSNIIERRFHLEFFQLYTTLGQEQLHEISRFILSLYGFEIEIESIEVESCMQPKIKISSEAGEFSIDLVSGEVSLNLKTLKFSPKPKFVESENFRKIFLTTQNFYQSGNELFFESNGRKFSCNLNASSENFIINLRLEYEGRVLEFARLQDLREIMPETLSKRFLFFIDSEKTVMRGFSRLDFREEILINDSGVYQIDTQEKISLLKYDSQFLQAISPFERFEMIESTDKPIKIRNTYFINQDKIPFEVVYDTVTGAWLHPSRDGFILSQNTSDRFGKFQQIIKFSHADGRAFYYIPTYKWKIREGFPNFSDQIEPVISKEDNFTSMDNRALLMEYTQLEDGTLEPTTLEAHIYLIGIYLRLKRFDDFDKYLKKIDAAEPLSSEAIAILKDLLNFLSSYDEGSSENSIAKMHLISKFCFFSQYREYESHSASLGSIYHQYLLILPRVADHQRLSFEDEVRIAKKLNFQFRLSVLTENKEYVRKRETALLPRVVNLNIPNLSENLLPFLPVLSLLHAQGSPIISFPELVSAKLGYSNQIFGEQRDKIVVYAKSISNKDQLDHLSYFIDLQIQYATNFGQNLPSENSIIFLVYLKAICEMKSKEITGEGIAF